MNARTLAAAVAAAFSLGTAIPAIAAEANPHAHHAEAPVRLTLDNGRKWATDDALRHGMGEIRSALEARRGELRRQSLGDAERRALGETVEARVGEIIANCKLTEKADANLHLVLAEVLGGAESLRNGPAADAAKAADRIAMALDSYGRHFDHPGWARKSANARPLTLAEAIELIARTYPGRTIAAQSDPVGGAGMHHHVDMMLPNGRVAKFDVDARTQRIYNRLSPEAAPEGTISLADAVKKVQLQAGGRVVAAEYDPDPQPHYHMSVQGRKGELTRLDLDLASGHTAPHRPRS